MSQRMLTALIPLPLFYNPNPDEQGNRKPVEDEKFVRTGEEIATNPLFGGGILYVFRHEEARGFWWDKGVVDKDVHALLEVDIPDTEANRAGLESYAKDVLLRRFRQKAIYIKFVGPVQTLLVRDEEVK